MGDFLFSDFPPVSSKQWKQKIQFDLNGLEYNKTLLTHTNDGITIKPFYHNDNCLLIDVPNTKDDFKICQTIFISNEKTANFLALDAIKKGANSVQFIAENPFDIEIILNKIPSKNAIHFQLEFLSESFIKDLILHLKNHISFLNIDIIGHLANTGNWFQNLNSDFNTITNLLNQTSHNSILQVDTSIYQNSGANIIQQVSYALAHGNEYLNHLENNLSPENYSDQTINFNFSIGTNYFFEIAKLRAFRILWKSIVDEYNFKCEATIFAQPSIRNKTLYDYNTNLLRTTSECMSAILGGANTVSNTSYDTIYHKKNEFGERIARNQLLILKEESSFKNAGEFAKGSYYIESLTNEIAQKALVLFKDIEKTGGFLKQLKDGTIQRKIKESADKEQVQFDSNEIILIGTNKHPNADDRMKESIELYPFLKSNPRKTLIQPIIQKRLAEKLEKERLKNEA